MKKLTITTAIVLTVVCLSLAFTPGSAQAGHYGHGHHGWCGTYQYYPVYDHCYDHYVPYTPIYTHTYHIPHCYY
ncbi:MAG: hypothetical protein KC917_01100 [Candidatus Omnitrophica bacterium]|nr:hypothetical protein [Candidatus Omnitrophota bacterium]MCA9414828.1 hypothetical protein [Candidatus Omnitrophota bacterium]MCA9423498.1 hypothetical protein [Candidatus Omnitrophota bacterium]MCA9429179.1 hypothetical protein [Candidatus Omnitrophota bacterium]MCA9442293.1 hypothetical protein [Candidatus Omnitrophota bacterium]